MAEETKKESRLFCMYNTQIASGEHFAMLVGGVYLVVKYNRRNIICQFMAQNE